MKLAATRAALQLQGQLMPNPRCLDERRVAYCPLGCGFLLLNDWDGHFLPCLVQHALEVWYAPNRS